jgi:hypothetical protein
MVDNTLISSTTSSPGSSSEVTYRKHPLIKFFIGENMNHIVKMNNSDSHNTHKHNLDIAEILNTMYKKDKTTYYCQWHMYSPLTSNK